jgi:hypothetical protein
MGDMKNACRVLGGKHVGNKTLGRSKLRWDCIIQIDLK